MGLALFVWAVLVEPGWVVTREISLPLARWPARLGSIRVAALSDLHTGAPHVPVEALRRINDPATPKQKIVWRGLHDIHVGSLAGPTCIVLVRRHPDKGRDQRHAVCMPSCQTGRKS